VWAVTDKYQKPQELTDLEIEYYSKADFYALWYGTESLEFKALLAEFEEKYDATLKMCIARVIKEMRSDGELNE
jgi:hypothetical protein